MKDCIEDQAERDCPQCVPVCVCALDDDPIAQSILREVRDRLVFGRGAHGTWQSNDAADFMQEGVEELLDGMIYFGRRALQIRGKRP